MKNVIIYLMASLALFACQNELEVEKATKPGKELLRVSRSEERRVGKECM